MAEDDERQQDSSGQNPGFPGWVILWVVLVAMAIYVLVPFQTGGPRAEIPYNQFKSLVNEDRVAEVTLRGHAVEGSLHEATRLAGRKEPTKQFTTRVPEFAGDQLIGLLERHNVEVHVAEPTQGDWRALLVATLPWILLIGFGFLIYRNISRNLGGGLGPQGQLGQFMRKSVKRAEVPDVNFDDVAGEENAKQEVTELVEYLREPERFRELGAEVPKGVLLLGPPGTGKTLLARALAGEANVPFYTISGSEFIEMFVGVGASRVRNLFDEAKKNAPSIIFIDELDSIGRKRGAGLGGGHDEREQTLNQILAQMDGFEPHEAVIVLAATNRPDVLDQALLRPGRFDRHVSVDLPNRKDRVAILKVHTRNVPIDDDVDLERVAASTPGFSGADLENLVNEGAMQAARERSKKVTMAHLEAARDKVTMGPERNIGFTPEERHRLAVHESGHTIVGWHMPHADPIHKVSIIPRGQALGGTQQLPEEERYTIDEDYLRDRLAVMLGGRAAEEEVLGNVSSGADDDIRQATRLARSMVTRWGMAEEIGPMDLRQEDENPFLGEEMAHPRRFSEASAEAVDQAVQALLQTAEQRARETISAHRKRFDRLVKQLEDEETLYAKQIEACLETTQQAAHGETGS